MTEYEIDLNDILGSLTDKMDSDKEKYLASIKNKTENTQNDEDGE